MTPIGTRDQDPEFFLGLEAEVDKIYADHSPGLFADHRGDPPWLTGYLGNPFAPVWFVAENPSLSGAGHVRKDKPTWEDQWTSSPGDRLFRGLLGKHGLKDGLTLEPGGWRCYITDVIKSADVVGDFTRKPAAEYKAIADAWAPALRWELENGKPRVVVSVGERAEEVLNRLLADGQLPDDPKRIRMHIPHYAFVASKPDKHGLRGSHPIRVCAYDKQIAEAVHAAGLQSPASPAVILRATDGREVDLGAPEDVQRILRVGVSGATGGSSGRGMWLTLFGYQPDDRALDTETVNDLADEAKSFKEALQGSLDDETVRLLDRITAIGDYRP